MQMPKRSEGRFSLGSRAMAAWSIALVLVLSPQGRSRAEGPEPENAEEDKPNNPEMDRLYGIALDHWLERSNRLQRIAQRLSLAGSEICERSASPILGAAIVDLKEMQEEMQEALLPTARKRFGAKHRFYVTAVFDDMASKRAGLQVGDAVLAVNGAQLESSEQFYSFRPPSGAANRVEIERIGELHTLEIDSEVGCGYPASVEFSENVNAYAHRNSISVNSAYMRYLPDDQSMAVVVGHEIGHNVFWRESSLRTRKRGWASRRSEARADYVGFYLTAIAGYPLTQGVSTKRGRLRDQEHFLEKSSHPTTPARMVAERKTIEEIEDKIRRGEPLRLRFE